MQLRICKSSLRMECSENCLGRAANILTVSGGCSDLDGVERLQINNDAKWLSLGSLESVVTIVWLGCTLQFMTNVQLGIFLDLQLKQQVTVVVRRTNEVETKLPRLKGGFIHPHQSKLSVQAPLKH